MLRQVELRTLSCPKLQKLSIKCLSFSYRHPYFHINWWQILWKRNILETKLANWWEIQKKLNSQVKIESATIRGLPTLSFHDPSSWFLEYEMNLQYQFCAVGGRQLAILIWVLDLILFCESSAWYSSAPLADSLFDDLCFRSNFSHMIAFCHLVSPASPCCPS